MTPSDEIAEQVAQFSGAVRAQARAAIAEETAAAVRYLREEAARLATEDLPPALREVLLIAGAQATQLAVGGDVAARIAAGERSVERLLEVVVAPLNSAVALAPRSLVAAARGAALEGVLRALLHELLRAQPPAAEPEPQG
jgi:hypothetical protein